jgi:enoyl-[acyl-carrier protein] reductase II
MQNPICNLFGIKYPLIQAGMIWCSGWELASAVSNAGGLGIIGSGSMYPEVLRDHILKCKAATKNPFAVNIPLLYPDIDKHIDSVIELKVPIVFTSAGNPVTYTAKLKKAGIKVVHVIANTKFALKAETAGVDAIVAEGFEAGGHNGREETTTMCLVPLIKNTVKIPVIAAGGIGDGKSMAAAMALGADGVQVGSRFVLSEESSAHTNFKNAVANAGDGSTRLSLKALTPVRLLDNKFARDVLMAEQSCKSKEELALLLGKGRSKKGMFEGDLEEGELEIGQVAGVINEIYPAAVIVENIMNEYHETIKESAKRKFE